MPFKFYFKRKEANFSAPVKTEVDSGTHISIENILKFKGKYIALRRPKAIPGHQLPPKAEKSRKDFLYFAHGLPHWGEGADKYIRRIVKEQAGVGVKNFRVVHLTMEVYPDKFHKGVPRQWAITPFTIVELSRLPKPDFYGNKITEVVHFEKKNIPDEFGWWEKKELRDFLEKFG